jgi:hypothetical protein
LRNRDQLQGSAPTKVISSAITIAKRGRRIKNVSIPASSLVKQLNGYAVTQALDALRYHALPGVQAIGHHDTVAMLTGGVKRRIVTV